MPPVARVIAAVTRLRAVHAPAELQVHQDHVDVAPVPPARRPPRPVAASAATVMPSSVSSTARSPARTTGWSRRRARRDGSASWRSGHGWAPGSSSAAASEEGAARKAWAGMRAGAGRPARLPRPGADLDGEACRPGRVDTGPHGGQPGRPPALRSGERGRRRKSKPTPSSVTPRGRRRRGSSRSPRRHRRGRAPPCWPARTGRRAEGHPLRGGQRAGAGRRAGWTSGDAGHRWWHRAGPARRRGSCRPGPAARGAATNRRGLGEVVHRGLPGLAHVGDRGRRPVRQGPLGGTQQQLDAGQALREGVDGSRGRALAFLQDARGLGRRPGRRVTVKLLDEPAPLRSRCSA